MKKKNAIVMTSASDVTARRRQRGTSTRYNEMWYNYKLPAGGIPYSDMYDLAHVSATYPDNTISHEICLPCLNGGSSQFVLENYQVQYSYDGVVNIVGTVPLPTYLPEAADNTVIVEFKLGVPSAVGFAFRTSSPSPTPTVTDENGNPVVLQTSPPTYRFYPDGTKKKYTISGLDNVTDIFGGVGNFITSIKFGNLPNLQYLSLVILDTNSGHVSDNPILNIAGCTGLTRIFGGFPLVESLVGIPASLTSLELTHPPTPFEVPAMANILDQLDQGGGINGILFTARTISREVAYLKANNYPAYTRLIAKGWRII